MPGSPQDLSQAQCRPSSEIAVAPLLGIALAVVLLHVATNGRYGFHRDELQFLSDARHLDWGFVAYPPLTPFVERISMALFGLSMVGLRLFSVLGQAAAIVLTGLMARDLGGQRLAQITAALAVALSPLPLFSGTEFQYTSFDFLWWVLTAYFTVRLLTTGNPRWWIGIGVAVGLGLMTKYSILFYIAGILAGVAWTPARRYLKSGWFWAAIATSLVLFLPNLVWLFRHDFISYHFLQSIHARDVRQGRADGFLRDQILIGANLFAVPLWMGGLIWYFRSARYRMLAWMFVVPLVLFYLGKGRFYYTAAAYPMLIAAGAAAGERWLVRLPHIASRTVAVVLLTGIVGFGAFLCTWIVPLAASGPLRDYALKHNGDLREEIGWTELVQTVAAIRDSLPPDQQTNLGVLVGNYGEQGAIEILGPAFHLPLPISMTNSAWLRGYPTPPPDTLIVVGFSARSAAATFSGCRLAGHPGNALGMSNEESRDHPDIFVCGPPRQPWPVFWQTHQFFG